jgi:hypothetical protein
MEVNKASDNSVMGATAGEIANDGTGTVCPLFFLARKCEAEIDIRRRAAGSMAGPVQRLPASQVQVGTRLDQNHRRDRGWAREVQQGKKCRPIPTLTHQLTVVQAYERFGFHVLGNNDITYEEWAPNALRAYLIGDFSMELRLAI